VSRVPRQRLVFLLRRVPHLTREQFQDYWWNSHRLLVRERAEILGISKYQQCHTVQDLGPDGADEIDGIAELWFDGPPATGTREQIAKAGNELLEDERTFIDLSRSPIWIGPEYVLQDRSHDGLRLTGAVMRRSTVSREEFQKYWLGHHGPTALAHPDVYGLGHYVQVHTPLDAESHPLSVSRGAPEPPDGIAEAWLTATTASADHVEAVRASLRSDDAPYFDYDRTVRFMSNIRVVVDR